MPTNKKTHTQALLNILLRHILSSSLISIFRGPFSLKYVLLQYKIGVHRLNLYDDFASRSVWDWQKEIPPPRASPHNPNFIWHDLKNYFYSGELRAPVFLYQMLMKGDLIWLTVASVLSCIGSDATFG